ncbi:hypothetical protein ACQCQG_04830 [Ralstonia pseudosolanacearum]|uniref:hypothetical protein n=1 Tax=Ralstonia pseudosolanacearum TaxID=1310165 RepID=UPI0003C3DCF7|nr:hypothetical protein L665_00088 [Ralstonia solanacearum SD54]
MEPFCALLDQDLELRIVGTVKVRPENIAQLVGYRHPVGDVDATAGLPGVGGMRR